MTFCSWTYRRASAVWRACSRTSATGRPGLPSRQEPVEVQSLDQAHDQIPRAGVPELIDHLDDARMREPGEQAGLDLEAVRLRGIDEVLDRDGAAGAARAR